MAHRFVALLIMAAAALISPPESVHAQNVETPFGILVADWTADLDVIEQLMRATELTPDSTTTIRRTLTDIVNETTAACNRAQSHLPELEGRLLALGPAPDGEAATAEPEAAKTQCARLELAITEAKAQVGLADLTIARAAAIEARIGAAQVSRLLERLAEQGPLPIPPPCSQDGPGAVYGAETHDRP